MIDGTDRFVFIGLINCGKGAVLLFQEGMLVLDPSLPGWGVMPHAVLARLFPECRERHPAPPPDAVHGDWPTEDEQAFFEALSESVQTDSSRDGSRSSSPSPRGSSSSDVEPPIDWVPPDIWLGWWPAEAPLRVARVGPAALARYRQSGSDARAQMALLADLRAGHLAAPGAHDQEDGVMVELRLFGRPRLLAWAGRWLPAGHPALARGGLAPGRIAALVAHAQMAPTCNLAEVPEVDNSEYLGHVEDAQARVLVFGNGLLVQHHPQGRLEGWHPLGPDGHWALVAPTVGDVLADLCEDQADMRDVGLARDFFSGDLDEHQGPRFTALTYSATRRRWMAIQLDAPHGLIGPDAASAPSPAELLQARRTARRAAIHNWQLVHGPFSLGCGAWQVPVFLGLVRCLVGVQPVPGLLGTDWHDTLQPLIERQLLAHRGNEQQWLADGVILQPIDNLLDLMRRDKRLCRREVSVMWPMSLLDALLKSIAPPTLKAKAVPLPRLEDVEAALTHKAGRMLVFKGADRPVQSAVVAVHQSCWSDEDDIAVEQLRARVRRAYGQGAFERVVGMVTID